MPNRGPVAARAPAKRVGAKNASPPDWQAAAIDRIRELIRTADPEVVEEQKWKKPSNPAGVPVWSRDGIICTGERYKTHVRFTFARGASLSDPDHLFNSGFEGRTLRAIVLHEGEEVDAPAFQRLIRAAAELNASSAGV